jgi:hypothetical protein
MSLGLYADHTPYKANPTTSAGKTDVTDSTTTSSTGPTTNLKPYESSEPTTSAMSDPTTSRLDGPSEAEIPSNPNNAAAGGALDPLANTEGTGVTGSSAQKFSPSGGDAIPSSASNNPGAAPSSGAAPGGQKQQGADRPEDAPSDRTPAKEDDTEAIMAKRDPNDHSGEPMHMHGGDENSFEKRRESKVGNPGGLEHGAEPKGTGEEWVKTSGLHADGGDFDATKPGAGREADRESKWRKTGRSLGRTLSKADGVAGILEEKGVHRDQKGAMENPEAAGTGSEHTKEGKVSKLDKIKDKLHIGGSKDK